MSVPGEFRGQPLIAAVLVFGIWFGTRIANWEAPPAIQRAEAATGADLALPVGQALGGSLVGPQSFPVAYAPQPLDPALMAIPPASVAAIPAGQWRALLRELRAEFARNRARLPAQWGPPAAREWAGLSTQAMDEAPARQGEARYARGDVATAPPRPDRWSLDAWALVRSGSGTAGASGILPATYGASQAGSILRYRIAPDSRYRPTAYLRTTSTLGGIQETSAALGAMARPMPAMPVAVAVEGRVTDQAGTRRVQPAVMAITELPLIAMPHGFRGEVYGQGGYVGGKFATPFADAQARMDRDLVTIGRVETRIGAGAWAGAQKGANRLDIGPTATVTMPVKGTKAARVALDWRIRVGGNAEPESGPALTVSAGF